MIKKELVPAFKNLIKTQDWICLSTVNSKGLPETRAMINLANPKLFPSVQKYFDDSLMAYFSTNTSSEKMEQLALNNKASVYYYNPETFEGLLLMGTLEIIEEMKIKKDFWQDSWTIYYKKGLNDPDYTLLKFNPSGYKYYNGKLECVSGSL